MCSSGEVDPSTQGPACHALPVTQTSPSSPDTRNTHTGVRLGGSLLSLGSRSALSLIPAVRTAAKGRDVAGTDPYAHVRAGSALTGRP